MQILKYGTGSWDADTLGNHRVVLHVNTTQRKAVRVFIPWRRRDHHPEHKRLILVEQTSNSLISNFIVRNINRESVELVFQPVESAEDYFLYFSPYDGTVKAPYPQINYLPPVDSPPSEWVEAYQNLDEATWNMLPEAQAVEIQSIDELHSFFPMEVIATQSEIKHLLEKSPEKPFLLFPEDRQFSIRMTDDLPYRWIETGPSQHFQGIVSRGEVFPFQIGVFAARSDLTNLQVDFSGLSGVGFQSELPAVSFWCVNLGGVDWTGKPFKKDIVIPSGKVQALWCCIELPEEMIPGDYYGEVTVSAHQLPPQKFPISLQIESQILIAHGDNEPERLSRLRWLDSTIALDDEVTSPFTPILCHERRFEILGRVIEIGEDGLPTRLLSFLAPEMTHIQADAGLDILNDKISFSLIQPSNQPMDWQLEVPAHIVYQAPGRVVWQSRLKAGPVILNLSAELEFDGNIEYSLMLQSKERITLEDAVLKVPYQSQIARFMLGLGYQGGYRPDTYQWKWDVKQKNQDSIWLGDVNAGLQVSLKDEHYTRPLNTNFYTLKPLVSPVSWDNNGQGSIRFFEQDPQTLLLVCSGGPRILDAGETLYFNLRLAITPFKPIVPAAQWSTRFYHSYKPVDQIAQSGANTINVHHANDVNPYINYPFLRIKEMKAYIDQAHAYQMKVKIYYTVRELTNHAPEFFALRSLGDEVLSSGPGGGHSWLQEHLVSNYVTGWHVYSLKDVAVVNSGTSRWHNFYLEGLDWLARNVGIDGLYIDDLAFDRTVMKRVRKILDRRRSGSLIDLHSANQFRERDGFANSANLYMEHFPYLNRLWFGEYFDYNLPPDFWMVEVSGIPFGLMGEMLQDGGNPWRGMLYGMTSRIPWSGDPTAMWKAWDDFGIQESKMIGYWSPNCPVKTDHPEVLATVYLKKSEAMISIASWAKTPVTIQLRLDWESLRIQPEKSYIYSPAIQNFQDEKEFKHNSSILVEPGKGWLLILSEQDQPFA